MIDIIQTVTNGDVPALQAYLKTQPNEAACQEILATCNEQGMTLMHIAAEAGHLQMLQYLLYKSDIPFDAADNAGRKPLDLAADPAIIVLLRSRARWEPYLYGINIEKLFRGLQAASRSIDQKTSYSPILVLGETGVGKSTLLNYLNGATYRHSDDGFSATLLSGNEVTAVGHSLTCSETLYPKVIPIQDLYFADLAGLNGTREPEVELAATLSIDLLARKTKNIQAILFVINFQALDILRAGLFRQEALMLFNMLERDFSVEKLASVFFVVTKAPQNMRKEDFLEAWIARLLGEYQTEGQNITQEDQAIITVLTSIQENPSQLFMGDIFDSAGATRDAILTAVRTAPGLEKRQLDLLKADAHQQKFHASLTFLAQQYNQSASHILDKLPQELPFLQHQLDQNEKDRETFYTFMQQAERGLPHTALTGLRYQSIPGDGHCLFNAVVPYLVEESAASLRERVATHLEENFTEYEAFYAQEANRNFSQHITDIRAGKEWGAHIEIEALQRISRRPIIIIRRDANPTLPDNLSQYTNPPIFVYYNGHNHYDSFAIEDGYDASAILTAIQAALHEGRYVTYNPHLPPLDTRAKEALSGTVQLLVDPQERLREIKQRLLELEAKKESFIKKIEKLKELLSVIDTLRPVPYGLAAQFEHAAEVVYDRLVGGDSFPEKVGQFINDIGRAVVKLFHRKDKKIEGAFRPHPGRATFVFGNTQTPLFANIVALDCRANPHDAKFIQKNIAGGIFNVTLDYPRGQRVSATVQVKLAQRDLPENRIQIATSWAEISRVEGYLQEVEKSLIELTMQMTTCQQQIEDLQNASINEIREQAKLEKVIAKQQQFIVAAEENNAQLILKISQTQEVLAAQEQELSVNQLLFESIVQMIHLFNLTTVPSSPFAQFIQDFKRMNSKDAVDVSTNNPTKFPLRLSIAPITASHVPHAVASNTSTRNDTNFMTI